MTLKDLRCFNDLVRQHGYVYDVSRDQGEDGCWRDTYIRIGLWI